MEGFLSLEPLAVAGLERVSSSTNCVSVSSLLYSNGASKFRTASIGSMAM